MSQTWPEAWPKSSSDERDPLEEQGEEKRREAEIQLDKPPHHE